MILRIGSRGEDVRNLQLGLAYLGYHPGIADGVFGEGTERAVSAFQTASGLLSDGEVGDSTLSAYNFALGDGGAAYHIDYNVDVTPDTEIEPSDDDGSQLNLTKPYWPACPADQFNGQGNEGTVLRSDIAPFYQALYDEVHDLGGIVTSAGGRRLLTAGSNANRSKKSFHYVGRAFDLAPLSGMADPETDPYIIEADPHSDRHWEVWCRSSLDKDALIKKLYGGSVAGGKMTIEAWQVIEQKDSGGNTVHIPTTKRVQGVFFSFTDVALKHGFNRIRARRSFFTSGNAGGAEWWHFQNELGLLARITTFGSELRKTYSLDECREFAYWDEVRNAVFGLDWF